jgi:predicted amidohydrolase YtcJ
VDDSQGVFLIVGRTDEILAEKPSKIIALKGQFIMSGLDNAHSHLMLRAFQRILAGSAKYALDAIEQVRRTKKDPMVPAMN